VVDQHVVAVRPLHSCPLLSGVAVSNDEDDRLSTVITTSASGGGAGVPLVVVNLGQRTLVRVTVGKQRMRRLPAAWPSAREEGSTWCAWGPGALVGGAGRCRALRPAKLAVTLHINDPMGWLLLPGRCHWESLWPRPQTASQDLGRAVSQGKLHVHVPDAAYRKQMQCFALGRHVHLLRVSALTVRLGP
jgi:hypothetical protein